MFKYYVTAYKVREIDGEYDVQTWDKHDHFRTHLPVKPGDRLEVSVNGMKVIGVKHDTNDMLQTKV